MLKRKPTSEEKHKFEEGRAKKLLELCFPDQYIQSVLSESPDIINEKTGIGVEVTDCYEQELQRGLAWANAISGKKREELSKASRGHIASGEVYASELSNGKMLGVFARWGKSHNPQKVYLKKTEKLNAPHFRKFPENNLFIVAWMMDDDELDEAINYFTSGREKHFGNSVPEGTTFFDKVYVFSEKQLVEVIIEEGQISRHFIMQEDLSRISHAVFKEVFGMTREEYYKK